MAKEISASAGVTITDLGNTVQGSASFQLDFSGALLSTEIVVPTTATLLSTVPVTTLKVLFIKNMDAVNYIELDHIMAMTAWVQKLGPGQASLLLPEDGVIYARANTAAVKIWLVAG